MNKLLDLISLKKFEGGRTQITIVVFGLVNILNQIGVIHLTAEQLIQANSLIGVVAAYFFADKLSK